MNTPWCCRSRTTKNRAAPAHNLVELRLPQGWLRIPTRESGMRILFLTLAIAVSFPALADEGMWTFDEFPSGAVKRSYGMEVTPGWLDHVRLSTLRLTNCTA